MPQMLQPAVLSSAIFAGIKAAWDANVTPAAYVGRYPPQFLDGIDGPYREMEWAKASPKAGGDLVDGEQLPTFPCVVVKSILHSRESTTNVVENWRHVVVFEVRGSDFNQAEEAAVRVANVFDTLLLTLPSGQGRIWNVRRINDEFQEQDESVDCVRLKYQYRHEKPKTVAAYTWPYPQAT